MTVTEITNSSRALLDESTAALFTSDNVYMWINAAERDICAKTGCLESIEALTTTASQRYVSLSSLTCIKVNSVELVESGTSTVLIGGEVNWKDTSDAIWKDTTDAVWKDYERTVIVPNAPLSTLRITPHHFGHIKTHEETKPKYWLQWGNYILIEPIPDDAYTLNAYMSIYPTDVMDAGTESPQIPYEFQEAIVPYICMMAKLKKRKYSDAAAKYAEYTNLLQRLIDTHIRRIPTREIDIRIPDSVRIAR